MKNKIFKSHLLTIILIVSDIAAFIVLWVLTYHLRAKLNPYFSKVINEFTPYVKSLPWIVVIWVGMSTFFGLYSHYEKISSLNQLSDILNTAFYGLVFTMAFSFFFKEYDIGRFVVLFYPFVVLVYLYFSRSLLRAAKSYYISRGIGLRKVLIIGAGKTGLSVMDNITNHPEIGFDIVGFIDDDVKLIGKKINNIPVIGNINELTSIIEKYNIEEVFFAIPSLPQDKAMNIIVSCEKTRVDFKIVTNLFEVITSKVKIDEINEIPLIKLRNGHLPPFQAFVKRTMDLVVAIPLFIITLPLFGIICLWIRLHSPGPAVFKQERVGKDGERFILYKFRTMHLEANPYQEAPLDSDDSRVLPSCRWLRKSSLDELPQLINVIIGNMSMVGPRPEMPFIVDRYEEWQRRRLDVKPGLTGLWQVVGRKNLPLYLNLEYDFYYIKNQSVLFDISILIKTIPAVLFGKGAF